MVELEGLTASAPATPAGAPLFRPEGRAHDQGIFCPGAGPRFPEHRPAYDYHLNAYGEVVGHVFFCEINPVLSALLRENRERKRIRRYMDFLEEMYREGNGDARNAVL